MYRRRLPDVQTSSLLFVSQECNVLQFHQFGQRCFSVLVIAFLYYIG